MAGNLNLTLTPRKVADGYITASINGLAVMFDCDERATLLELVRAIERRQAALEEVDQVETSLRKLEAAREILRVPTEHPDEDLRAAAHLIKAFDTNPTQISKAEDILCLIDSPYFTPVTTPVADHGDRG